MTCSDAAWGGRRGRNRGARRAYKLTPGQMDAANRVLAVARAPVEHGFAHP